MKEANGRISFVILGVYADDIIPVPNNSALLKAEKAALNRTKRIGICHHFVRERVVSNEIQLIYCPTGNMIADITTKGLTKLSYEKLRNLLGVHDVM